MKSMGSLLKIGTAALILATGTVAWAEDAAAPAAEPAKSGDAGKQGEFRQKMADRMRRGDMQMDRFLERLVENPKLAEQLALTEDQIAKLKAALEAGKVEEQKLLEEQESGGTEQAKILMGTGEIDEQAVFAAIDKAGKARTELAKLRVKQLLLVKATLTPEQLEKMKEITRERAKAMRDGQGPRRGMNKRDREGGPDMPPPNDMPPPDAE